MERTLASDKNAALVLSILLHCLECSNSSSGGIANATVDRLVEHEGVFGKLGPRKTERGSARLTDDKISRLEKATQGL